MGSLCNILTIDLGGSGPKVALISEEGEILATEFRPVPLYFAPNGGVEQDADEWWAGVDDAVRAIRSRLPAELQNVLAVSIAGQWSVTVPVDSSGRCLARAISWMDRRGGAHSRRLMRGLINVAGFGVTKLTRWIRTTGGAPTPTGSDGLSHLLFFKNERPDVYRQAHAFLDPHDFIGMKLTGRMATSYASVFPYLLADMRKIESVRYDDDLLRITGIDRDKLPELVPVDHILGTVLPGLADRWGVPRNAQVLVGAGDSHVSILGSGATKPLEPHVCIGTSSWITCLYPRKKTDLFHSIATMPAIVPGQYMLVAEQGAAGKTLSHFVENWVGGDSSSDDKYARLLKSADGVPPGASGLMFLPWLAGSGPPQEDPQMRGGFLGMSLESTSAHAVRAIMEGVACNLRWLRERIEVFNGRSIERMNFIGGGAISPVWCQILADVMGCAIRQLSDPQYAIARGSAFSALIALKRLRIEDVPGRVAIQQTFEPNLANRSLYDAQYRRFRRAYKATRPLALP